MRSIEKPNARPFRLLGFGTDVSGKLLTREENLLGLMAVNREVVAQADDGANRVVLDMDSSESPVHRQQERSAYNGHFASVCYHPLFLFNDAGDKSFVYEADRWTAPRRIVAKVEHHAASCSRASGSS